jgi:hypothetical protein
VQPLVDAERKPGFGVALEASSDWRSGNTELFLSSGSALGRYRHERHVVFALVKAELGLQEKRLLLGREFEHLRYRVDATGPLQLEAFLQHDRDSKRRLALRAVAGSGPRFLVLQRERGELAAGVAYMLELERLRSGPESDAGQRTLAHRASVSLGGGFAVTDLLRLGGALYWQPRFDRVKDTRALGEVELGVAVTERLALKVTFSAAYDTEPPVGLRRLDTALKNTLLVHF